MWLKYGDGDNYELGTGHQCGDQYRYWFWGLSIDGAWMPLGHQTGITNGNSHVFRMERVLSGVGGHQIYYRIDGVIKKTYPTSSSNFETLDVGLESYCQACTVGDYTNGSLKSKTTTTGSWIGWGGTDGQQVNDPPLCGTWVSDITWRSGQEADC